MANDTSIEDYFQRADGHESKRRRLDPHGADDRDRDTTQTPHKGNSSWQPRRDYSCEYLGQLRPGPQRITFTARIVNIYDVPNTYTSSGSGNARVKGSKRRPATVSTSASGHLKILAKDDSGLIQVRGASWATFLLY